MNKVQIYYCVDINAWYLDKDDGFKRERESYDNQTDAINYFIKYHDCFLSEQKSILLDCGQINQSKDNICCFETEDIVYIFNADGTYNCKTK